MNYSDGAGDNRDCNDSQSPIMNEKHSSADSLNHSVIYADEGISVISNMSVLTPVDFVDNLNTTDENDTKRVWYPEMRIIILFKVSKRVPHQ